MALCQERRLRRRHPPRFPAAMDVWLGSQSLVVAFPPIFRVICKQNETLGEVLSKRAESHNWEFQLRRRLFSWEQDLMNELLTILDGSNILISIGQNDKLVWAGSFSNSFSVKSLYEMARPQASIANAAFDLIWSNVAPYWVQCFCWLVHLRKIKSSEYLLKIGIIQNEEEAFCKFCSLQLESVDHLLLHCDPVWQLWAKILDWWGVRWATPKTLVDLFLWWKDWNMKNDKKVIREVIPMATLWTIWNLRNNLFLEEKAPDWNGTSDLLKIRVALWVKSKMGGNVYRLYTMDDFICRVKSIVESL